MRKSVVVAGLGTFGSQAARTLYEGGATVLALDREEKSVEPLIGHVTRAICVDVNDEEAMEATGAFDMDTAVVALRHHFSTSVLAVHMFAKRGINDVLVHVENEREGEALRVVGATETIFPERDMAERVAQRILVPNLADQIPLGANAGIIEVACPASFVGKSLSHLNIRKRFGVTVIAVKTIGPGQGAVAKVQVAPNPNTPLLRGDVLIVLSESQTLERFRTFAATGELTG